MRAQSEGEPLDERSPQPVSQSTAHLPQAIRERAGSLTGWRSDGLLSRLAVRSGLNRLRRLTVRLQWRWDVIDG